MLFSSGQSPPSHPGPGAGSLSPSLFQKGLPPRPRSPGVPMELTQTQCSYLVEAAELWGNTLALGAWCAGVCKETHPLCSAAPEQATQLASFLRESWTLWGCRASAVHHSLPQGQVTNGPIVLPCPPCPRHFGPASPRGFAPLLTLAPASGPSACCPCCEQEFPALLLSLRPEA